MTTRVRKTYYMRMLELRHQTSIERLILNRLQDASGEFRATAVSLGCSQATLSRWVVELGLTEECAVIRHSFGLAPTLNELQLEPSDSGQQVIRLNHAIVSDCTSCGESLDNLERPEFMGVIGGDETHIAVIRGRDRLKHWFKLDSESLADLKDSDKN
jgi:arginine repressor